MSDNIVRWWSKSGCTMSIASMDEAHAALRARLAEAERERDKALVKADTLQFLVNQREIDIHVLRELLREAERDAARYRWLRDVRDYSIICERLGNLYLRMPHDLDAAIDAAIDAELERKP